MDGTSQKWGQKPGVKLMTSLDFVVIPLSQTVP